MNTNSLTLARKVDARLAACAALMGAAVAVPAVHATVVDSGIINFSVPNNFDGVYINFLTGATGTSGATTPGWDWNPYNSGTAVSFFWAATPSQASGVASSTTGPYLNLALGTTVSAASTFAQVTASTATTAFQVTGTEYLGFRFYNENTASINYGFVQVNTTAGSGFPFTIVRYVYENSGGPITVAAIPEPATVALLGAFAAGALGVRQWKRRRAA